MNILVKAIEIATRAHQNQLDSAGAPYILHPLRVMMRVGTADLERAAIAVLHDTREDHPKFLIEIEHSMPHRVLCGLELLGHRPEVEYAEYIHRLLINDDARAVKEADLLDNMDPTRFQGVIPERWTKKLPKYALALQTIKEYRP